MGRKEHEVILKMLRKGLVDLRDFMQGDHKKNCADIQILVLDIKSVLDRIDNKAEKWDDQDGFTEAQAVDVAAYLKCVHVGIKQFAEQLGLEGSE